MTIKKVCGLVMECNPFHAGHRKLIKKAKNSYKNLVALISGPFVQRGRPAIVDKWSRAAILIEEGIDLVIELPAQLVLQSADYYARGAVKCLSNIPCLSALAYGVEDEDYRDLLKADQDKVRTYIKQGLSYRGAFSMALSKELFPNSILAIQYEKAIKEEKLKLELLSLKRQIIENDPDNPSASAIRLALADKENHKNTTLLASLPYKDYLEDKIWPDSLNYLGPYLLTGFTLGDLDFKGSPHYEEGMDIRLFKKLREKKDLEQALKAAANKRQSESRYRRMLLTSLLKIKGADHYKLNWIRPLAFNEQGRKLLRQVKVPVIQKKAENVDDQIRDEFLLNEKAQKLSDLIRGRKNLDHKEKFYYK